MKFSHKLLGLSAFLFLGIVGLAIFTQTSPAFSQSQSLQNEVRWTKTKHEIKSLNSEININLPDMADTSEWIVGVVPAQSGEKEEVMIGIVSWTNAGVSNRMNIEKISEISNYPTNLIETPHGSLSIGESGSLRSGGKSLVVFLKIAPGTTLNILKDGNSLHSQSVGTGFAVQSGSPATMKVENVSGLLMQLQTNRLARAVKGRN